MKAQSICQTKLLKCIPLINNNCTITEVRDFISENIEAVQKLAILEQNIVGFTGGIHHILDWSINIQYLPLHLGKHQVKDGT